MRFVSYILHFALWWQNRQKCSGTSWLSGKMIKTDVVYNSEGGWDDLKTFLCPHTFFSRVHFIVHFTSQPIISADTNQSVCSKRINSSSSLCTHWIPFFIVLFGVFFTFFVSQFVPHCLLQIQQLNWRFYLGNIHTIITTKKFSPLFLFYFFI